MELFKNSIIQSSSRGHRSHTARSSLLAVSEYFVNSIFAIYQIDKIMKRIFSTDFDFVLVFGLGYFLAEFRLQLRASLLTYHSKIKVFKYNIQLII